MKLMILKLLYVEVSVNPTSEFMMIMMMVVACATEVLDPVHIEVFIIYSNYYCVNGFPT